ncbi:MAG: hypothetical protein RB292_03660 [Patescibacteria group bacterium]|jgi:hypothetical protein|nr:hypothetical protein [Patescibacteria group bacterium]
MNNEIKKYSELETAILKTLAFFDIFDYPLTLLELYKWLYQAPANVKFSDLAESFESANLAGIIDHQSGFYFFPGRSNIVRTRLNRYRIAEGKFSIALKLAAWLRPIPFIRMVAVCNNAAYDNANDQSDIDFFIVIKSGRIWLTRFLVTTLASLLRFRRHGRKITDRVCLSFYLTDDHLNLSAVALKPFDPYLVYWSATLAPIYGLDTYRRFIKDNAWLVPWLPNISGVNLAGRRQVTDSRLTLFVRRTWEGLLGGFLGDWCSAILKFVQLKKMQLNKTSVASQPDTRVIVSDVMLKFHEGDKRAQYYELWLRRLQSLEIL